MVKIDQDYIQAITDQFFEIKTIALVSILIINQSLGVEAEAIGAIGGEAEIGGERKGETAEREAEEEVQNGVAAESLGIASYVLAEIG
ncbi:uncharacterized protein G2W53_040593 [Senna tora]|uniref:Uncharacterized protein n=1 Tax=Senna tora TaxID=362788 RepID=A0A834SII7_9FABA|nr:uncharacterized protein G2W53_040593 [Senna tora]